MCGIAGLIRLSSEQSKAPSTAEVAQRMATAIAHRGPDGAGVWCDDQSGIALSHRRLSILDLSVNGNQPMLSASNRYVLCFNGEIYNHQVLRKELEKNNPHLAWRGSSDTETLLVAVEHWGIRATLNRSVGMFALSLWDKQTQSLTLVRDRFGEKPLYYGWVGSERERSFVFGSELKAIRACPSFVASISRIALGKYMQHCYVPAPHSIYTGIYKLEPGAILEIQREALLQIPKQAPCLPHYGPGFKLERWWTLAQTIEAAADDQITDETEAIRAVDDVLSQSIADQSVADVPLGAFLSGGIDSSTVVALMKKVTNLPPRTFTIGFDDPKFDESGAALKIAKYLRTEHTEFIVTPKDAQNVIPLLPQMYDEPFADSSQIPMHLVSKMARTKVTVALSGDAGDELFGGYNRYFLAPRVWNVLQHIPFAVRKSMASAVNQIPRNWWDQISRPLNGLMPQSVQVARLGEKVSKLSTRLSYVRNIDDMYRSLVTEWLDPTDIVKLVDKQINEDIDFLELPYPLSGLSDPRLKMMYLDTMTYLPGDILCKVDRASMSVGLEARAPFLDHRVAEVAWRLPLDMKIRDGQGKWILRQVLTQYVPASLVDRPKAGFGIPIGNWIIGPLREWAEDLLDETSMKQEGYLHVDKVQELWREHKSERRDWTARLWTILMFQAWLRDAH